MNLKELSQHLGLSQTTVSRALNGYPEVRESTRLRVAKAAAELGYTANANARRLATGRSGTIGMILPTNDNLLLDPHFVEFLAGVGAYLGEQDMDLLVSVANQENELRLYRRAVQDRRVDGVILSSPRVNDARIQELSRLNFPFVLHGRSDLDGQYAYLDIDNYGAFELATKHLLDLGHRRIAFFNRDAEAMIFAKHRHMGYVSALKAYGLAVDDSLIRHGDMTEENGFRFTMQQLQGAHPPTAFLCSSTLMGMGAIRAAEQSGLTVGRDISIISHDDGLPFLRAEEMRPALTTTRSSIRAAGRAVSAMLLRNITQPKRDVEQSIWPVELVVRDSTGPAPDSARLSAAR